MKRRSLLYSVLAIVIAFGLTLAGCSGGSGGSKSAQTGAGGGNANTGNSGGNANTGNSGGSAPKADYPKMEIKFSHVASDKTPKGQSALKFKEIVESKSGKNITVKVYPSGQLYGDNDEIEALQANNVQIIAPSAAKLSGFDKTYELFDLPFLFQNESHLVKFEDGEVGKKLLTKLEGNNMKGLAYWPNGFKHVTNNKVEVAKPDDLKNLKIRTHGGKIINEVYAKMGAASTKLAFNEVYQALQLGTVNGQENSLSNIVNEKYEEVQKHLTLTNHARSEYVLLANKKWWDGLNPATQALLSEAVKASTKTGRDLVDDLEKSALEKIKKNGKMKIHELSKDERKAFQDALQPVFDKWSATMDAEIIKAIKGLEK